MLHATNLTTSASQNLYDQKPVTCSAIVEYCKNIFPSNLVVNGKFKKKKKKKKGELSALCFGHCLTLYTSSSIWIFFIPFSYIL